MVLPFRFRAVADQFVARLAELAPAGQSVDLDGALARARAFQAAADRLDGAADQWRQRYAAGHKDEAPAEILNRCMKRLSRLLGPLQSTAKGAYAQDPYGFTAQTTMLPCLFDIGKLTKLNGASEERWMLETKLRRERNRVADALDDAGTLIDDAVASLK